MRLNSRSTAASGAASARRRRGPACPRGDAWIHEARQDVILPATGDEQVLPGATLDAESEPAEHPGAQAVARHVARHDAVQLQRLEHVRDRRAQRLRHVAVSLFPTVERVAEPAAL